VGHLRLQGRKKQCNATKNIRNPNQDIREFHKPHLGISEKEEKVNSMSSVFMEQNLREGMALSNRALQMSYPEIKAHIRHQLQCCGTNVTQNDNDPQGDGDQSSLSSVKEGKRQFYRDLFSIGGDINHMADLGMAPLSEFAKLCITGSISEVKKVLQKASAASSGNAAAKPNKQLVQLLETRETSLRLSPLLMLVSMGKNLAGFEDELGKAQIQVAKVLLEYGARPDARDVCGKTVCHYGMGAMATKMTIQVASLCIQAHQSNNAATTKLCDIPDRLGAVCLLEVIPANRTDVAKVLLEEHKAALDIADVDGISPRSMSVNTALLSPTAAMVNKEAGKRGRERAKSNVGNCGNCGKEADLFVCSRCKTVGYCGKECQKQHWKSGGHKQNCKQLAAQNSKGVVLDRPKGDMFESVINFSNLRNGNRDFTRPQREGDGYKKPRSVAVGEKFYLKVQGGGPIMPLMIYDKSRECNFSLHPGQSGFEELRRAVNAEPTWHGRKTYVMASFNEQGICTAFPTETTVKSHW